MSVLTAKLAIREAAHGTPLGNEIDSLRKSINEARLVFARLNAENKRLSQENDRLRAALGRVVMYADPEGYSYCRLCGCNQTYTTPSHYDGCVAVEQANNEEGRKIA